METGINRLNTLLRQERSIAPLVVLRIAFALLMIASTTRFIWKGWVYSMYVQPRFHFPYYGFEWLKALPEAGMILVFVLILLSATGILLGAFYRLSAIVFFLLFTYVELIDKTNYLNHYYFISLLSFLMIFLPVHRAFSVDNWLFRRQALMTVPRFFLVLPQLQMFLLYFFAGLAKLNADWLLEAQPLRIWLPAFSHYPIIGPFLEQAWVAYAFSWFGCVYDLLIGFFLFNRRTVYPAYAFVVVFHLFTAMFFNIGMFPYIMMTITIVFFREEFHVALLNRIQSLFAVRSRSVTLYSALRVKPVLLFFFGFYFLIQVFLPFRYLLYKGHLFWTEQGYRFSWRVMLMEKAGTGFFYVRDKASGRAIEVDNKEFLSPMQEKMMSTQPDMIVDYARFLKQEYISRGFTDPEVHASVFVSLNGSGSRPYIDTAIDLASCSNSFLENKDWILPFKQ